MTRVSWSRIWGPLLACAIFGTVSLPVSAQVSGGPAVAASASQLRDQRQNDTRYAGPSFDLGGVFEFEAGRWTQYASLSLGAGYLTNRLSFANIGFEYDLRYGVDFSLSRVFSGDLVLGSRAGGGTRAGLFVPEDPEHLAWFTSYELELGPGWKKDTGRHHLGVDFSVSAVALTSTPPDRTLRNNDSPRLGAILALAHRDPGFSTWPRYGSARLAAFWERRWVSWATRFVLEARWRGAGPAPRVDLLEYTFATQFRFGR